MSFVHLWASVSHVSARRLKIALSTMFASSGKCGKKLAADCMTWAFCLDVLLWSFPCNRASVVLAGSPFPLNNSIAREFDIVSVIPASVLTGSGFTGHIAAGHDGVSHSILVTTKLELFGGFVIFVTVLFDLTFLTEPFVGLIAESLVLVFDTAY